MNSYTLPWALAADYEVGFPFWSSKMSHMSSEVAARLQHSSLETEEEETKDQSGKVHE